MPLGEAYRKQVALLIKIVPLVAAEPAFALKGGTAINLFLCGPPDPDNCLSKADLRAER